MTQILCNKFKQNPELTAVLVNTGQKSLHEATGDHKWSTGAELASKALLNAEWQGQSIMGQLLQAVRNELSTGQQPNESIPLPVEGLDLDNLTPMPDDPFISNPSPPAKQSQPHSPITSTPVIAAAESHSHFLDTSNSDPYQDTGARPKIIEGRNITLRRSSQPRATKSPTPPPRATRVSRANKSSAGGIINC